MRRGFGFGMRLLFSASILIPAQAQEFAALCVDEGVTGFSWSEGRWVQSDFARGQRIVREVLQTEQPLGVTCYQWMKHAGRNPIPIKGEFSTKSSACYAIYDVGTEPSLVSVTLCYETLEGDGRVSFLECNSGGFVEFKLEPTGEFVATRTYAVPSVTSNAERDSIAIIVGKCSVIQAN